MRRGTTRLSIWIAAVCACWAVAAKGADGPPEDQVGSVDAARAPSEFAITPSELMAMPQDAPHYQYFVDAEGGFTGGEVVGPQDGRSGVCLPEGGSCGAVVYKNLVQEYYSYSWNALSQGWWADDIWLAGNERDLCQITVRSYGSKGAYHYTFELWTDCPDEVGAEKLYGPVTSPVLPAGYSNTSFQLSSVHAPTLIWISQEYYSDGALGAGPIITEMAEIGFTADLFGKVNGTPPCAYFWISGGPPTVPWSGFGYEILATGTEIGKCCYNNCADCVDTTYADCLSQPGNPEFLLGTSCTEAPDCGKGACCLTNGTCVANRTLAECEALPLYQATSWSLGTDCTAHGSVAQKFCAPVPANDLCANAITLTGTCVTAMFNNAGATLDGFTMDDTYYTVSCLRGATAGMTDDDTQVANNIWYKWRVPTLYDGYAVTAGRVIVSTLGSRFDTVLAVYAVYGNVEDCGVGGSISCEEVSESTEIGAPGGEGCNNDIVAVDYASHEQIQLSYVEIEMTSDGWIQPGACLLIMVGGLSEAGTPPGGPGQLNIDFIPTEGTGPWSVNTGVCCLPTSGCIMANAGECESLYGFHRPYTDFYEGGASPPAPFEGKASGCCHGDFGSCVEGEFCGKAIDLGETVNGTLTWNGNVHRVTWFKFVPRDPVGEETEYSITIDTCGSGFDTVLSVYGPDLVNPSGECGDLLARNDDCTLDTVGAEGRVDCAGLYTRASCLCLNVNTIGNPMTFGETYYIGVGLKDARGIREEGIDPVANYPIDDAVPLGIKIIDTWTDCLACDKACCKADMDGNGTINGLDIQPFVNAVIGTAPPCRVDDPEDPLYKIWCRANMNGDAVVDLGDIPLFVNALLVPWPCDESLYCLEPAYCQLPNYPTPGAATTSDLYKGIKMADNFFSFEGGQITRVCWWGCYYFANDELMGPCTPTFDDDFTITFYTNLDNRPGEVIAQYSGIKMVGGWYTLVKTATGRYIAGGAPEYKYEVTGLPPTPVGSGDCTWIEIVNNGNADCWWWWEEQTNAGDHYAAEWEYGYYRWIEDVDLTFCVNTPIWDQGCNKFCAVPCPEGSLAEGEPECYEGYEDHYNAGCYWLPEATDPPSYGHFELLATNVSCGDTICGTSGIFSVDHWERDSDWYQLEVSGHQRVTLTVEAEFTAIVGFMEYAQNIGSGDCADLVGADSVLRHSLSGHYYRWSDRDDLVDSLWPRAVGRCVEVPAEASLPPGTYYLVVMPDFNDPAYHASRTVRIGNPSDCGMKYTLSVECEDCQSYPNCLTHACPGSGYAAEPEACGEDTNGGCDSDGAAYGTIVDGDHICGTVWADMARRDTDWYEFSLPQTRTANATLTSEFPGTVSLLRVNTCQPYDVDILATAYSTDCTPATAQATLPRLVPGPDGYPKYAVFVAPGTAAGPIYECIACTDPWSSYDLDFATPAYCQPWESAEYTQVSDLYYGQQYRAADDFYPTANASITNVCWWGVLGNASLNPCTLATASFNIAFYYDNAGAPGTALGSTIVAGNVAGEDTGVRWDPTGYNLPIYAWQVDIPSRSVSANQCYWVSIWNTTGSTNGCYFRMLGTAGAAPGNGRSGRWEGTTWNSRAYDFGYCVNIACSPTSCPQ